jgi:multiple sugar transport system ATP-binding protein
MAELRLEGVSKRFGDFTAVDQVELSIPDREFMVLLGPSGCGKSTLLRAIAGLEPVSEGSVLIGGRDVTYAQPKDRGISMVFQSYAVFPHITVFDNIAFGLVRQKKSKEEIKRRVGEAADLLHISELLDRYPNSLSGGQRQRVAVARSIAYDAEILLMDEPLSNLDALLRMEMRAELKALVRELGATVIYVTHDQVEALSMGDRIAVMNRGALQQVDSPIVVYDRPASTFVAGFIGNPPMNLIPAIVSSGSFEMGGATFPMPELPPPKGYLLGVRAENIDISDQPPGIPAEVMVAEPLGSHNLLTLTVGDRIVKVATHPDHKRDPGDSVFLQPLADKVRWFDLDSGWGV